MSSQYMMLFEKNSPTFKEFAWRCAQAFAPYISTPVDDASRTVPADDVPRAVPIDESIRKNAEEAERRLAAARAMPLEEAGKLAEAAYQSLVATLEDWRKERAEDDAKHFAMLAEIDAWTPPSEDHAQLRDFMKEEILNARKWRIHPLPAAVRHTAEEYKSDLVGFAEREAQWGGERWQKEQERVAFANKWIAELVESIGAP